jgi:hypothetical protein
LRDSSKGEDCFYHQPQVSEAGRGFGATFAAKGGKYQQALACKKLF